MKFSALARGFEADGNVNVNVKVNSCRVAGLVGRCGCAGHAVNPSMEARFSHPCEKTVLHSHP
ncbi:MAG: hypothetical protein QHC77_17735, partial [Stenotrophomonas sp.]|uniref:hypothetical protein n=1 Tax=Stenotrophomonas sp. TaxID=69392 RepID=UPI0029AF96B4